MQHRLIGPVGLVKIKGILLRPAIEGHQTFVIARDETAVTARGADEIELSKYLKIGTSS